MQWGQIKTLFIIAFLILNIYLLFQFLDKRDQANIGILERQESTIEEQLEAENITLPDLPEEQAKEPFISVRQKTFTDSDMEEFQTVSNQDATLISKKLIVSVFDKPIPISKDDSSDKIEETVAEEIVFPEDYVYWDWNEDMNMLIFFQEKNDRPIYFNQNGIILVYLNDDDEMVFYTQTMLGKADSRQDKKTLIKPIDAIEELYKANELYSGDDITNVDIGFHTMVPLENGVQVFVPTWKVKVNDEKSYFVNAIEGFVFSGKEEEFLEEVIQNDIERIESSWNGEEESKTKEQILQFFNEKLTEINRGGTS